MFEHIRLSETAIAVLRFELRGWKAKDPSRRVEAYRELAEAGLMEVVQGGPMTFRFRSVAVPYLSAILAQEEARELGERQPTPDLESLSLPELRLFARLQDGEDVAAIQDGCAVQDLVRTGVLIARNPFDDARRTEYRLSEGAGRVPTDSIRRRIHELEIIATSNGESSLPTPRLATR